LILLFGAQLSVVFHQEHSAAHEELATTVPPEEAQTPAVPLS
jgi:hypothetical protein